MFNKDLVYCSVIQCKQIPKHIDRFDSAHTNLFELFSDYSLLNYMVESRSKTIYPITAIKAIVVMKQLSAALGHLQAHKIAHCNIRPANIVFGNERDLHSLKLRGFENAALFEDNKQMDLEIEDLIEETSLMGKMALYNKIV